MRTLPLLGDRYRLGPIIGTGGMGAVYRAFDERFGREVAVKVVRSGADAIEQERLRREAQYLAGLDHPNLVAVYDAGTDSTRTGETVWFAMELIEGPDLRHVLRESGPLSTADAARVLEGAAGALQVLHEAGVVHRDLKPANVLLTADPASGRWEMKLADLGIAQLMRAEQLTSTGQVIGTAAYLSPEQVSGGRIGPAVDVYALGLLMIEALTGCIAFPGGPVESAAARLVRAPDVPHGLDPAWRALLIDMTARHPGDRPSTVEVGRRAAGLPRSAEPFTPPEATAVLPTELLRELDDLEVPTEAMAVLDTARLDRSTLPSHTTGWTPSLRRRPRHPMRRRRAVLAAGALAVAVTLAGGGAAIVGGTSDGDTVAAQTKPSSTPSRSSTPKATMPAKATETTTPAKATKTTTPPKKTKTASVKASAAAEPARAAEDEQQQTADVARAEAGRHAWAGLHRLQDRLEQRLRERLSHR